MACRQAWHSLAQWTRWLGAPCFGCVAPKGPSQGWVLARAPLHCAGGQPCRRAAPSAMCKPSPAATRLVALALLPPGGNQLLLLSLRLVPCARLQRQGSWVNQEMAQRWGGSAHMVASTATALAARWGGRPPADKQKLAAWQPTGPASQQSEALTAGRAWSAMPSISASCSSASCISRRTAADCTAAVCSQKERR